jgi:hypothetical protein
VCRRPTFFLLVGVDGRVCVQAKSLAFAFSLASKFYLLVMVLPRVVGSYVQAATVRKIKLISEIVSEGFKNTPHLKVHFFIRGEHIREWITFSTQKLICV